MSDIRIIKKYANRRLYDTEEGNYITLNDVKQLVFDHVNFKVIDAKTKKDLTQSTLLQIISEQESGKSPLFSNEILQNFIRFYNEKSQDSFHEYMKHAMDVFMKQRNFFENQWDVYQDMVKKAFKDKNK